MRFNHFIAGVPSRIGSIVLMKLSWEREYLRKDHDLVLKLFDYRCIVCGKLTNEVHEIVPISNGRKYLAIKNRVPLCRRDHAIAHESTRKSIPVLQDLRKQFIVRVLLPKVIRKYPQFMISQMYKRSSKINPPIEETN